MFDGRAVRAGHLTASRKGPKQAMMTIFEKFINIRYRGERFAGGRLPVDVLSDLQALEDILTTFAREIYLEDHGRQRMPTGHASWFEISLKGVGEGSALPLLDLSVSENSQSSFIPDQTRRDLMRSAERKFAEVLQNASDENDIVLSPAQIRNFNRFLPNLKPGENFQYSADPAPITDASTNVISLDTARRKRMLTSVKTTYEQRIQGKALLKNVDVSGALKFVDPVLKEIPVQESPEDALAYAPLLGSYYEYDLTVTRRHDDSIVSVETIHDLTPLDHPALAAIDEMASLESGWLEGHGSPVREATRNKAKEFIQTTSPLPEFYAVAPTEAGGVLLEYEAGGWDYGVEFNDDGSFEFFGIELSGSKEIARDVAPNYFRSLQEFVKDTIK